MQRRRDLLIAALACLLLLAGCLGGSSEGTLEGDLTEAEFESFVENRNAAAANLETYSIAVDMDIDLDRRSAGMAVEGDVNAADQVARLVYDIDAPGPRLYRSEFTAYFDDTYVFVELADDGWDRIELAELEDDHMEEIWEAEQHTATDDMYHYGDVTVDVGDDVVTITTELSGDEMAEILKNDNVTGIDIGDSASFDEFTIVETIDAETYYPLVVEMSGSVSERGETATISGEIELDDHDEDVDATIPEEVRDAAEDAGPHHPLGR